MLKFEEKIRRQKVKRVTTLDGFRSVGAAAGSFISELKFESVRSVLARCEDVSFLFNAVESAGAVAC